MIKILNNLKHNNPIINLLKYKLYKIANNKDNKMKLNKMIITII